ncbi:MAG: hypothetical protein NW205_07610 [Hyphomicrobiaceae bacterium]|nr:hypothetical protein [Hyphomicrobiaceae bacterium]
MELGTTSLSAAGLDTKPHLLVDQPQFGDFLSEPLALGVLSRNALPRRRVFEEPLAVIDNRSSIKLVVQDAVEALRIAKQGGSVPEPSARAGHLLPIEIADDGQWPFAFGVLSVNAPYDLGFALVRCTQPSVLAVLDDVVAVALATRNSPFLYAADLAATGLLCEVLEEKRGHCAFEADVDL